MSLLWDFYWPVVSVALAAGLVAGVIAFRAGASRRRRNLALLAGLGAALLFAWAWHGPLEAGQRFAASVERQARETLDAFEMTRVEGRLQRSPLGRTLRLSGPADDFQRSELVRIMGQSPGVSKAAWPGMAAPGLPLIAEVAIGASLGFGLALLLAYLLELRRRSRAQWRW